MSDDIIHGEEPFRFVLFCTGYFTMAGSLATLFDGLLNILPGFYPFVLICPQPLTESNLPVGLTHCIAAVPLQ